MEEPPPSFSEYLAANRLEPFTPVFNKSLAVLLDKLRPSTILLLNSFDRENEDNAWAAIVMILFAVGKLGESVVNTAQQLVVKHWHQKLSVHGIPGLTYPKSMDESTCYTSLHLLGDIVLKVGPENCQQNNDCNLMEILYNTSINTDEIVNQCLTEWEAFNNALAAMNVP